jgi:hypothetical protein
MYQVFWGILDLPKVIKELNNRFGVIETTRTYKLQFSRRKQLTGESVEKFGAELKPLRSATASNLLCHTSHFSCPVSLLLTVIFESISEL